MKFTSFRRPSIERPASNDLISNPAFLVVGSFLCGKNRIIALDTKASCSMQGRLIPVRNIPYLEILLRTHCVTAVKQRFPEASSQGPLFVQYLRIADADRRCTHAFALEMQDQVRHLQRYRAAARDTSIRKSSRLHYERIVRETMEHLENCPACHVPFCQAMAKSGHRTIVECLDPLVFRLEKDSFAIPLFKPR